jgi:hypothetical protein
VAQHPASGHGRYLALHTPPPRHAMVCHGAVWPALVAAIGMLAATNVVVGDQDHRHGKSPRCIGMPFAT